MKAEVNGAAIRFDNATIGYQRHPAIHHIGGRISEGSLLAVVGPNGAGKSTLLKAIVGLLKPFSGGIRVEGCQRRRIAYLPQQAELDLDFPVSVFDFVAMGLWHRHGFFGAFRRRDDEAVAAALHSVGLAGFERRTLDSLSGGQIQRVLFARLTLQDSPLILLDEPFSAIDDRTTAELMGLVAKWHTEGRTVVAVLHDHDLVRASFPETLLLARSAIAWGPTGEVLSPQNLTTARRMNEAWDENAPFCEIGAAA
jgi:zinc/manganese transport system ATP-binding protein